MWMIYHEKFEFWPGEFLIQETIYGEFGIKIFIKIVLTEGF